MWKVGQKQPFFKCAPFWNMNFKKENNYIFRSFSVDNYLNYTHTHPPPPHTHTPTQNSYIKYEYCTKWFPLNKMHNDFLQDPWLFFLEEWKSTKEALFVCLFVCLFSKFGGFWSCDFLITPSLPMSKFAAKKCSIGDTDRNVPT